MRVPRWGSLRWLPITLSRALTNAMAVASALAMAGATASAQGGHTEKLHVNPAVKECSFQLDASLTQSAWRQFAGEAGVVTYFRPMSDARPMGAGKFEVSIMQWKTGIHAADAAWNDTFVHPDSMHWLFEGDGLQFPGLMLRTGVTEKTDLGVYLTKSPGANYGFYGAQVQHSLLQDAGKKWAGAARMSFVSMYGPKDLEFTVYGLDLVASRKYAVFSKRAFVSPYAGVSTSLSRAHEKTPAVNLADESVLRAQGMVGAAAQFSRAKLAVEYGLASVPSLSIKIGVGPRSN